MIPSSEQASRIRRLVSSDDWHFAARAALEARLVIAMKKCATSRTMTESEWRAEQERCRLLQQLLTDPESLLLLPDVEPAPSED